MTPMWTMRAVSDHAVLLVPADDAPAAVPGLVAALTRAGLGPGTCVQPAYASVLIRFEPRAQALAVLMARIAAILPQPDAPALPPRLVEIPVVYGGAAGPDLDEVAARTGLSAGAVVERHAAARYTVAFLGFAPGFAYLVGLPGELGVPRLAAPRARVPAGSVAVAGGQAGVYPLDGPGGWRILGRTPLPMFDPEAPAPTLLRAGDAVRFVPISGQAHVDLGPRPRPSIVPVAPDGPRIEVAAAGPLSTVQDLGRPGLGALGISAGGAADADALRIGNRLVENDPEAPAIELTARGGTFTLTADCSIALTGADCAPQLTDAGSTQPVPIPMWETVHVAAGQTLRCGALRDGVRSYLCVAGGLDVPRVLGSAATDLRGGFGGLGGRALRSGDRLGLRAPRRTRRLRVRAEARTLLRPPQVLRVTEGAQADWFDAAAWQHFLTQAFLVTPQASRIGLRLAADAPVRTTVPDRQLQTEGVALGAVQIPAGGQPIVLGVDQQTTGGYPQIACVVAADLSALGRLRPGDAIRFERVTLSAAAQLLQTLDAGLSQALEPVP